MCMFIPTALRSSLRWNTRCLRIAIPRPDAVSTFSQAASGTSSAVAAAQSSQPVIPPLNITIADVSATSVDECYLYITPKCLETLYQFSYDNVTVNNNNSLGVLEYGSLSYLEYANLDSFLQKFKPEAVGHRPIVSLIDGAVINQTDIPSVNGSADFNLHGEADLDFEYAVALTYPSKINYYQVGRPDNLAGFNNFLDAIDESYCSYEGGDDLNTYSIDNETFPFDDPEFPKKQCGAFKSSYIISTSYGGDEIALPASYMQRQCNEYAKLGMMGISFFYSSGDSGVAGGDGCIDPTQGASFQSNLTNVYTNGTYGLFTPSFPSTCPYVTSVGATQIDSGKSVYDAESVANVLLLEPTGESTDFAGGGGFSNVFGRPSYQADTVRGWLEKESTGSNQPSQSLYNMTSRAYPDLSANGVNYTLAIADSFTYVYGTSASCPTVASLFSLINNERLNAGKKPVGFVNPTLYKNPSAFNDITTGSNPGCGTEGFFAGEGWDASSGLGTPNYPKLLKVFMSLP